MHQQIILTQPQAQILNDLEVEVQRAQKIRDTALFTIIAGVASEAKFVSADVKERIIIIEVPDLKAPLELVKEDQPEAK